MLTGNGVLRPDLGIWRPDLLVDAAGRFGLTATTPMLWVYSENDQYIGPEIASSLSRSPEMEARLSWSKSVPMAMTGMLCFSAGAVRQSGTRWSPAILPGDLTNSE